MRKFAAISAGLAILVVAALRPDGVRADEKRKPKFTIGKETTFVTGPIDEDGYVDYGAAINERLSKGVTADNNANVLLWKAMGPRPEGSNMPADYYKWLGIAEPPENAEHQFKYLYKYFNLDQDERQKLDDQLMRANKRPWTAQDYPRLAEWLKGNDKSLAVVHEATSRSHYFSPLVTTKKGKESGGLISCLLPGVQKCRELANVLTTRAMLNIGEGRYDEAWRDLIACHRLGRHVAHGGTLIESLVGIAIDAIASNSDLAYIENAKLNAKQLAAHIKEIQSLPPMPPIADKIDQGERLFFLDSVMMMDRHGSNYLKGLMSNAPNTPDPLSDLMKRPIDWDPALRSANQWYDRIAAAMRNKDRSAREKELDRFEEEIKDLKKPFDKPDELAKLIADSKDPDKVVGKLIGDVLIGLLMPAVRKVMYAGDRSEQINRNLQVALALAAYRADNGRYPQTLDALSPKYLAQTPGDLFSGKALIYKPAANGYLVYSVGQDGKDDGGRWYDDNPRGDDPNVRMPLPKLPAK